MVAARNDKPLAGKRILVTRARHQASVLAQRIESLGGSVVELPTIEIVAPDDFAPLDQSIAKLGSYDWLMFTSVNSVEPFLARLAAAKKSVGEFKSAKVAAIGSETAKRLAAAAIHVDLVPSKFQAEGILEALDPAAMAGKRVLIPRAAKAREVLPDTLRQWGATVDVVEAYKTIAPATDVAAVRMKLQRGAIDLITFTSSSTVTNFSQLFGGAPLAEIAGGAPLAAIGPITAATIVELGGRVAVAALEFTIDGLIDAVGDYFTRQQGGVNAVPQNH